MRSRVVVLDRLEPFLRSALVAEARRHGLDTTTRRGDWRSDSQDAFLLAVVQVDGLESNAIAYVRDLRRELGQTPCVALGKDLGEQTSRQLRGLGVRRVVDLPTETAHVVARCFAVLDAEFWELAGLLGQSPGMERVRKSIVDLASASCNVLITGETGTGKGLVARAIHALSTGAGRDFVHVDCGGLSPDLIESELFGCERGAFTGAAAARIGRFEAAGDGAIFLDEVGDLGLRMQAKLLRVLDDREFERVGGRHTLKTHARVLSATSRDLEADVATGRFRAALYYRLRVTELHVPPLRERRSDIPQLASAGVERIAEQLGVAAPRLSDEAIERLALRDWPGNVRELMNSLEAALVRRSRVLRPEHLQPSLSQDVHSRTPAPPLPLVLPEPTRPVEGASDERAEIPGLLAETGGNVARVARRLNMARSTLRYKIRRYQLDGHILRD